MQHCLDDREDEMQNRLNFCSWRPLLVGLTHLSQFAILEASSTYPEKKFDSFFVFENAETLTPLNDELLFFFMIME